MKKFSVLLLVLGLMVNLVCAQAPMNLHVKLLNNSFNQVSLTSAYGNAVTTYATVDINGDEFNMIIKQPNDIYRLDFGNGSFCVMMPIRKK